MDFKALPIRSLISTVIAACTGPIAGIRQLQMDIDEPDRMQGNSLCYSHTRVSHHVCDMLGNVTG